jgi:hypothetical protein
VNIVRSVGLPELLIALAIPSVFALVALVPFWRIFSKAGLAKQLSILMLVPLLNLGVLYYLAFADWPSLNNSK